MPSNNLTDYSKIIVIGNGFDLNLGLKTRYSDFIATNEFLDLCKSGNDLCQFIKRSCNRDLWVDVELQIKEYASMHSRFHDEEGVHIKKFSASFFKNYQELIDALADYLNRLDYGVMNEQSAAYKMINEQSRSVRDLILDFNYTPCIDLIFPTINLPNKTKRHIKIHGSCSDKNIIVGIQDQPEINVAYSFVKKSSGDNYNPSGVSKYLLETEQIHFFGHSLGETDEHYFKRLFRNFSPDNNPKKIFIYFHGDDGKRGLIERLSVLTDNNLSEFREHNDLQFIRV